MVRSGAVPGFPHHCTTLFNWAMMIWCLVLSFCLFSPICRNHAGSNASSPGCTTHFQYWSQLCVAHLKLSSSDTTAGFPAWLAFLEVALNYCMITAKRSFCCVLFGKFIIWGFQTGIAAGNAGTSSANLVAAQVCGQQPSIFWTVGWIQDCR